MNQSIKGMVVNIVVFSAAMLFSLLLLELGLRLYYSRTGTRTTIVWDDDILVGRRLKPSQNGVFVSNTYEYKTPIEINSKGFRDTEHTFDKPSDVYRILLIGDSFVENFQVPINQTVFKQIENIVSESLQRKVEVIAMGLGDSGTAQQLLLLRNYGFSYHPDVVVQLFFTGNDVKNNSSDLYKDEYRPYFTLKDNQLSLNPFKIRTSNTFFSAVATIKKNSRLLEFILNTKGAVLSSQNKGLPNDYDIYRKNPNSEYQNAWKTTEALILQSKKDTEDKGSQYILVSLANNEQVNKEVQEALKKKYVELTSQDFDFDTPDIHLQKFCQENSVKCEFMQPIFKEYISTNNVSTHYPKDGHWNQIGTNLAATFISEKIISYLTNK